jgi:hypothetical protein
MSSPTSGRIVRRKRQRRRSVIPKIVWAVLACGGAALVIGGILFALNRLDRLSRHDPLPGYVADVGVLVDEYRRFNGDTLDAANEVSQFFVRADEQMLRGDLVAALASMRRVSRDAAVPVVFTDIGVLSLAMHDEAQALQAFREVFVRDPSYGVRQDGGSKELAATLAKAKIALTAEAEPNSGRDTANLIPFGGGIEGEILDGSDVDSFRLITPPAPRDVLTFEVTTASATLEPGIRIYDSEMRPMEEGRALSRPGKPVKVQLALPPNRPLYVQVWGGNGTTGRYVLRGSSTHAFDAYEPNDTLATATLVHLGSTTHASILDGKDIDTYLVESPVATTLTAEVLEHSRSLAPALTFFGPDKNRLTVEPRKTVFEEWLKYQFTAQAHQRYYIQVSSEKGTSGEYTLKVE